MLSLNILKTWNFKFSNLNNSVVLHRSVRRGWDRVNTVKSLLEVLNKRFQALKLGPLAGAFYGVSPWNAAGPLRTNPHRRSEMQLEAVQQRTDIDIYVTFEKNVGPMFFDVSMLMFCLKLHSRPQLSQITCFR